MTTQYCELHNNRPKFALFPIVFQGQDAIFHRKSEEYYAIRTCWRPDGGGGTISSG